MKTILITGGLGFIGSNFVRYVLAKYDDIKLINLDSMTYAANPQNLRGVENEYPGRYIFVKGDICDPVIVEKMFQEFNPESVVNFAAESHVDRSIDDPNVFIKTNVLGTATLLNSARKFWKNDIAGKRFLQMIRSRRDTMKIIIEVEECRAESHLLPWLFLWENLRTT